jgi:protein tyrosine phosphatase (PTP) superfamily phosphohydrolase (DUF442 family)
MPVEEIKAFLPIDERIGTAGQPTEDELRDAATEGYRAVVNLGLLDPRYCLPDEAGLTRSLGLAYRHIPVRFDAPTMDELGDGRVLVHCAANYRVSSFIAVYGEMRLGWSRERADAHARTLWPLNDVWSSFLDACRRELLGSADRT